MNPSRTVLGAKMFSYLQSPILLKLRSDLAGIVEVSHAANDTVDNFTLIRDLEAVLRSSLKAANMLLSRFRDSRAHKRRIHSDPRPGGGVSVSFESETRVTRGISPRFCASL